MVWKGKVVFGVLLAAACIATPAQATVVCGFDPDASTHGLGGGQFTVDIVADITDVSVFGWGLDLDFSTSGIVQLDSITLGPLWDEPGSTGDGDGLAGAAFPDSVSGLDLLLATLTFTPLALGETDLILSHDNPPDLTEGFPLDPTGFEEDETFNLGHITIVPEPATLALLFLSGLVAVRRRR